MPGAPRGADRRARPVGRSGQAIEIDPVVTLDALASSGAVAVLLLALTIFRVAKPAKKRDC